MTKFFADNPGPPKRVTLRGLAELVCGERNEETIVYYMRTWHRNPRFAQDWARTLGVILEHDFYGAAPAAPTTTNKEDK